jgi:hypothetical protein
MALKEGSGAIDAGNSATCSGLDQRGIPRIPISGPCDIGAFEGISHTHIVNKNDDHAVDGTCDATDCTLREAVLYADADDVITFAPLNTLCGSTTQCTITLESHDCTGSWDLDIQKRVTIVGPGADKLTIRIVATPESDECKDRIFQVGSEVLNLSEVTLADGEDPTIGNGNLIHAGRLNLDKVVLKQGIGGGGGAIKQFGGTITITNSSIFNNEAANGGGIQSLYGKLLIANSTIYNNQVGFDGGGLWVQESLIQIINVSLASNDANNANGNGAGIYNRDGKILLLNTVISENAGGTNARNCGNFGTPTYKGIINGNPGFGNIQNPTSGVTDETCSPPAGPAYAPFGILYIPIQNPSFGTFNMSATLPYLPLGPTSLAANVANNGICAAYPINNKDQIGATRPVGALCDVGAIERP